LNLLAANYWELQFSHPIKFKSPTIAEYDGQKIRID